MKDKCENCDESIIPGINFPRPLMSDYSDNLNQEIMVVLKYKEIRIYSEEDGGYTFIPVNYCPKCGRKL